MQVQVFEEKPLVGGACRTEYPFPKVPGLGHSTGKCLALTVPVSSVSCNCKGTKFLAHVDHIYSHAVEPLKGPVLELQENIVWESASLCSPATALEVAELAKQHGAKTMIHAGVQV